LRYFEDFAIGELRRIGSYTVSRDEIIDFARRFDPQPFHIDDVAARESIFGGLTGSSCHTFALMSLIHARCDEETALVANLGAESLRFPSPLRPDDEITLSSECAALRRSKSHPGIGIVTTRSVLTNQQGETVMEMTTNFMVKQRGSETG
jgi:acyl dehydratase